MNETKTKADTQRHSKNALRNSIAAGMVGMAVVIVITALALSVPASTEEVAARYVAGHPREMKKALVNTIVANDTLVSRISDQATKGPKQYPTLNECHVDAQNPEQATCNLSFELPPPEGGTMSWDVTVVTKDVGGDLIGRTVREVESTQIQPLTVTIEQGETEGKDQ